MNRHAHTIEQLTLNAWPSLQQLIHDGWLLRFAEGYTKRANSIQPLWGHASMDLRASVGHCEQIYHSAGLPAVFKLTPFSEPAGLDKTLDAYGYRIVDPSRVMVRSLEKDLPKPSFQEVRIENSFSSEWLEAATKLLPLTGKTADITKRLLSSPSPSKGFFRLYRNGIPVACGFGVVEAGFVGLYDIVTDVEFRNQGIGEQLVLHILHWAVNHGAHSAYLQVVGANAPANRLYTKLGFEELYPYWYRARWPG